MFRYHHRHSGFGYLVVCDWCAGKKYVGTLLCPKCDGAGRTFVREDPASEMHLWAAGTILLFAAMILAGYLIFIIK